MKKTTTEYFCDHCGVKVHENQSVYFKTWSGTDAAGSRDEDGPSLHLCATALVRLARELMATSRLTTSQEGIPRPFTDSEREALARWITKDCPNTVDLRERGDGWLQRKPTLAIPDGEAPTEADFLAGEHTMEARLAAEGND